MYLVTLTATYYIEKLRHGKTDNIFHSLKQCCFNADLISTGVASMIQPFMPTGAYSGGVC